MAKEKKKKARKEYVEYKNITEGRKRRANNET